MAAPKPGPLREELRARAYKRSLQGASEAQIAMELGVSDNTVGAYLKLERKRRAKSLEKRGDNALADFEEVTRAVMEDAWDRLQQDPGHASLPAAHLQKNILDGAKNIATARGAFVERRDFTSGGKTLEEIVRNLMSQPEEVRYLEDDVPGELDGPSPVLPMRPGSSRKSLAG